MQVDALWAFDQYEAVRAALPDAACAAAPEYVERLTDLSERFDVFLLDAFGVLNIGETAIPGAVDFIAALRRAGKRVAVVSNSASVPTTVSHGKFLKLGFDFTADEIITSRDALKRALAQEPARRWGVMAAANSEVDELGVDAHALGDDAEVCEMVEGFILLGSAGWSDTHQDRLAESLTRNPRPVLVGNPDLVAPREDGLSLEPGYFAHDLARRTGCAPRFYGKPFGAIFEIAAERLGPLTPETTLMVGDTLHTDVLGGSAMGLRSCLLRSSGLFKEDDVGALITASGIRPDVVAERL